jgi:hypothetical protein
MTRALATAILKTSSGQVSIDAEAGVIRGVKLMELGKLARFAGEDGMAKQVTITDAHISALLAHAGNRSIPIHLTHDWFDSQGKPNADTAEMNARIGAAKNIRRDESGNAIADAYFKEGASRNDILWGAQHNPEDNCFSVVFSYLKDDPQCIPQNFRAADLVPSGAATTALFSEHQTEPDMTKEETLALLKETLPALLAEHKTALLSEMKEMKAEETDYAEMEKAAGVCDDDKLPEDEQSPALMRSQVRISRAIARQVKSLATEKTAILAEAKVQATAEATALLGRSGFPGIGTGNQPPQDAQAKFNAAVKELTDAKVPLATATLRVINEQPEVYAATQVALFKPASKL